jgi:cell division protein FtsB
MSKKFYTIMIVPHATAKFRRIRVSRNLLIVGGAFLSVLVVAGLMFPHLLLKTARLRASVAQMQQENVDLKKANERFDASLTDLRGKLSEIEGKAAKFALMVGVEDVGAQPLPAGGSSFDIKGMPPSQAETIIAGGSLATGSDGGGTRSPACVTSTRGWTSWPRSGPGWWRRPTASSPVSAPPAASGCRSSCRTGTAS